MVNITKKHVGNTLVGLVATYIIGFFVQGIVSLDHSSTIANYLSNKREAIVRNIEDYNTKIKIAREPYLSQYKDSLEYAIKDTTGLEKEISTLREKVSKNFKKVPLSWAGFFVD